MKKKLQRIIGFVCIGLMFFPMTKVHASTQLVTFPTKISEVFPDENLALAISEALLKNPEDEVTANDLKTNFRLFKLDVSNRDITSLEGLQYTGVSQLTARDNMITDLSPLHNMTNLRQIILDGNPITSIESLGILPNLQRISLEGTALTDIVLNYTYANMQAVNVASTNIGVLSDISVTLPNLHDIYISDTPFETVSDLLPLAHTLRIVDVSRTNVKDFSQLASFTQLTNFMSAGNPDADFESFPVIQKLGVLDFSDNQLSDVTFLSDYTSIPTLYLRNNEINSPDVLKNMQIGYLYLDSNNITDASWVLDLNNVLYLYLEQNHISDISFLENQTQFKMVIVRDQSIELDPIHLGSNRYVSSPDVSYFNGFESSIYDTDDNNVLFKSNGTYDDVENQFEWTEIQPDTQLAYEWDMYLMSPTRTLSTIFSGVFIQPVSDIGYTIEYYHEDRLHHSDSQVYEGSQLEIPDNPNKELHRFVGWYQDELFESPWNFDEHRVTGSMTLYARFIPIIFHTVTVDMLDGTAPVIYQIEEGTQLEALEVPNKNGYLFKGWYIDREYNEPWDQSSLVDQSMTLYARWEVISKDIKKPDLPKAGLDDASFTNIAIILVVAGGVLMFASYIYSSYKKKEHN